MNIKDINFEPEFTFQSARSGGKGGQNVNKVETKMELYFNIAASALLNEEQKAVLLHKLSNRLDKETNLKITSQKHRSQLQNKNETIAKFYDLIERSLQKDKPRKATRIPKGVKEKRLENKKQTGEKKKMRSKPINISE